MTTTLRTCSLLPASLVAAVLLSAASTAAAQPSVTPPVDDSDISQINGHPVPVGDHNQYHYSFKRTNISANPLGWMVGIYGVSGSYALNQTLVVKGDITLYDSPDDDDYKGLELSVGMPIYFRRAYSGAFLEPGIMYRRMVDENSYDKSTDVDTAFGPQVLFGWHWSWDSGLNVAAAAGVGRSLVSDSDKNDYDHGDAEPFFNGYFRIGYQF